MQSSVTVPLGSVIAQNPAATMQVAPGGAVALIISSGVVVPSVVGQTRSSAQSQITSAGLTVGTVVTQASSTVPAGSVISQNPTATSLASGGTPVALVVSSGAQLATVPNVVGQSQSNAQTMITGAGLILGIVTTQSSDTVLPGNVMSQNPAASTQVPAGTPVSLVISSGVTVAVAPIVDRTIFSDGVGTRTTSPFSPRPLPTRSWSRSPRPTDRRRGVSR